MSYFPANLSGNLIKPKAEGTSVASRGFLNRLILAVPDIRALEARLIARATTLALRSPNSRSIPWPWGRWKIRTAINWSWCSGYHE